MEMPSFSTQCHPVHVPQVPLYDERCSPVRVPVSQGAWTRTNACVEFYTLARALTPSTGLEFKEDRYRVTII